MFEPLKSALNALGNTVCNVLGMNEIDEKEIPRIILDKTDVTMIDGEITQPLFRVVANKDFGDIKKGTRGGYVSEDVTFGDEKGDTSWVYPKSYVAGDVRLRNHVKIKNSTIVAKQYVGDCEYSTIHIFGNSVVENSVVKTTLNKNRIVINEDVYVIDSLLLGNIVLHGKMRVIKTKMNSAYPETEKGINININEEGIITHSHIDDHFFVDADKFTAINTFFKEDVKVLCSCILNNSNLAGITVILPSSLMFDFNIPTEYLPSGVEGKLTFIAGDGNEIKVHLSKWDMFSIDSRSIISYTLDEMIKYIQDNMKGFQEIFDIYLYTFTKFITIVPNEGEIDFEDIKDADMKIKLTEEEKESIQNIVSDSISTSIMMDKHDQHQWDQFDEPENPKDHDWWAEGKK